MDNRALVELVESGFREYVDNRRRSRHRMKKDDSFGDGFDWTNIVPPSSLPRGYHGILSEYCHDIVKVYREHNERELRDRWRIFLTAFAADIVTGFTTYAYIGHPPHVDASVFFAGLAGILTFYAATFGLSYLSMPREEQRLQAELLSYKSRTIINLEKISNSSLPEAKT